MIILLSSIVFIVKKIGAPENNFIMNLFRDTEFVKNIYSNSINKKNMVIIIVKYETFSFKCFHLEYVLLKEKCVFNKL